jgi:hypothetical protein
MQNAKCKKMQIAVQGGLFAAKAKIFSTLYDDNFFYF